MQQLIGGGTETKAPTPPRATPTPRRLSKTECDHFRAMEHDYNPPPWQPQIPTPEEQKFRHSGWSKKRATIRKAMAAHKFPESRLTRFDCCGSGLSVEYSEEEKRYRVLGCFCHDRHCEPCMRSKANIIAKNLRAKIENKGGRTQCEHCKETRDLLCENCNGTGWYDAQQRTYRFITLTLRHTHEPLKHQIKRLLSSFRKLRCSKPWRSSQAGGSQSLEIKWKPETGQWHPHLHIISEGNYCDKAELSAAWHHATGDSFIVDIRQLRDAKEAAYYVAKYAAKGVNADVWSNAAAAEEWLTATQGTRTCGTWGTWRGYQLLQHEIDNKGWKHIGTLDQIVANAKQGQRHAVEILMQIVRSADPEEVRSHYIMDTGDG